MCRHSAEHTPRPDTLLGPTYSSARHTPRPTHSSDFFPSTSIRFFAEVFTSLLDFIEG
jgi:hypothetical protein